MTTHGDYRLIIQNVISRAKARADNAIRRVASGYHAKVRGKPYRKRSAAHQANYDKVVALNKANNVRTWENQRKIKVPGFQRQSRKPVTLPAFKSE